MILFLAYSGTKPKPVSAAADMSPSAKNINKKPLIAVLSWTNPEPVSAAADMSPSTKNI